VVGVQPDLFPPADTQRTRLLPDAVSDADPAEVVQERRPAQGRDIGCGKAQISRRGLGQFRHASGAASQKGRLQVGHVGKGSGHLVEARCR
jgi:hypothetical protein